MKVSFYKIFSLFLIQVSLILFVSAMLLFKNGEVYFFEYNFYSLNSSELVMVFLIDWMSMIFMSIVLMISSAVVYYSDYYMMMDLSKNRFLLLVIFFVLSMGLMIVSPNMISILLGWDGLGLISYCLVIYYQNVKSYNAGMLTILSNRIGDIAILLGISWMINYGGWNFMFYLNLMKSDGSLLMIGGLVILAGMTKSAQIPFSSWLPAAMAAPTPVSALVHSSTLVTAGVYLLIRFSELLNGSILFSYLLILGSLTMFMSGVGACLETDLKKIIALSTLSQLGLMMVILSLGHSVLAFFHLLTHSFFKSLLFLCAGVLIHSFHETQDIRSMGGVVKFFPVVCGFFNFSNLALCGFPFLAGFYSKDLILEVMSMGGTNLLIYVLGYFSTGLTVSYTVRLLYWSMVNNFSSSSFIGVHSNMGMYVGMYMLFMLSLFGGSALNWLILPSLNFVYLSLIMKYMVLMVILGGFILGILSFKKSKFKSLISMNLVNFMGGMWFMPHISTCGVNYFWLSLGGLMKKNLDYGWLENNLVYNLVGTLKFSLVTSQVFHLNSFKIYIMIFIGWVYLFSFFMILN
nr:NADH dehydrogenase subunit 5 [Lepidostoma basale]